MDADDHLTTVASIAGFSGIAEVAERAKYLDAEALKQRTFTTARRLVQRLTRDLPLVLLFEDWHWADASSADLLERLLPLVETAPLLIVVIGREAPDTRMAGLRAIAQRDHAARTVEIQLRPLGPEDAQRLAALLLGVDALPPAVRSLVGNKTEGNPLYVEELVRALVELGGIEWEAESRSWRATERFHELVIPDTLQALIRARIDLLDEPVKQVLKIAAVLGRIFPDRVLRILAGAELPLDDALATLKAAGFIREQRRMPELEYVFKHALMHDAAYDSILLQRRKELHRSAGETIEGLYAGRQDEVAAILAYHFARAEDWERAQDYLFKAGDRASRIAADAEVLDHYREAMRAYARAFGDRWDPLQRAVLERKIGEALYRRSEYLEGREHIERSLSLLGKPFPRARVGVRLGIMAHAMRQIGHRRIPWLFPPRPDPRAEPIFRAGEAMAWIDWFVDPERLVLTALRVLNYSEEMANEPGTAYGCMAFGLVCGALGLHSVAGGYHARGVATAERLGHPGAQALCYLGLGWHQHHGLGDGQSAEANYLRAAELYKTAGDTRRWASPMSLRALLFIYRGELARARALSDSMLREAEDAADDTVLMYVLREHGATLCAMGDHTRGEPFLTRAIELGRRVPDYLTVVHAMGFLGDSLLARGELEDALAVLEEGEAMVRERRIRSPYATALRDAQVSAYLRLARTGDRMALRKAEGALKALRAQARLDCEALPPLERWRGTLLWIRGDEKKARAAWDRSLAAARSTGGRLDAALTLLESGRLTKERARIEEAAREFEAMGALGRLAEARALL